MTKKFVKPKTKPRTKKTDADTVKGKFIGNVRGFGFIAPENSNGADIFIPPHFSMGALNGDMVVCQIRPKVHRHADEISNEESGHLMSGEIIKIVSRAPMIGAYYIENNQGYIRPVDTKIPYVFSVPPKSIARFGLVDGHRVVFSVDKKAKPHQEICPCFVTEVLGHINDPGVDVLTLVYQAGVPYEFSDEVTAEATALPIEVSDTEINEGLPRKDLRDTLIFTIDGDDTKDIDDAISFKICEANARVDTKHYQLGVHIADVTHYVKENSELDIAALERGTSIYLADRVIPMLPHKLSSGICSLFPDVDRLALSCVMGVDMHGHVLYYDIFPSVIRSKKRWTYNQVQNLLDSYDDRPHENESDTLIWAELFHKMDALRQTLYEKRLQRGALDFDLPESKIRVDDGGKPISIEPYPRTQSTGIIEEFMILCNETVASHLLAHDIPGVFRTHESPSEAKITQLQGISKAFGFTIPKNAEKPLALQRLLSATANTPAAYVVANAVLHSLPQAHYTTDSPSHYGLASKAYSHFTSPIRRYADLQIHRVIKAWLVNPLNIHQHFTPILPAVCAQCSRTERAAETLEREVAQLKKVQFMSSQEGQVFDATVSGITSWGAYVMLGNTIEGLVPTHNLRRHNFSFDKEKNQYANRSKKRSKIEIIRPGTPLKVRLVNVSEAERKITFSLNFNM